MADTRKDTRAPVSLKVRFKSADISEFMEQYSVDISQGGMFIQSKTPLDVGTLLKFELQLKDESKIIEGVGRVVWVRQESEAVNVKLPAGMGVKFIKMSPESRVTVERIVSTRGEKPSSYESIPSGAGVFESHAPTAPVQSRRSSIRPTEPALPDASGMARAPHSAAPTIGAAENVQESEDDGHDDGETEHTQVRHASEFLALALAEGASDKETLAEAERRAAEARQRQEKIEEQRAASAGAFGKKSRQDDDTERTGRAPFSNRVRASDALSTAPGSASESGQPAERPRPVLEVLPSTSEPPPPAGASNSENAGDVLRGHVEAPRIDPSKPLPSLGAFRVRDQELPRSSALDPRLVRMIAFALFLVGGLVVLVQCAQHRQHRIAPADTGVDEAAETRPPGR